jgi:hypothetical protein
MPRKSSKSTGPTCDGTTTCERSRPKANGVATSSPVGSPARTSALPGEASASAANGQDCGLSSLGYFAFFDLDSPLWKTVPLSPTEVYGPFSGRWPSWGLMRNGRCYRRPPSVPATYGRGCLLWPTANAAGGTGYMSGSKRDVWRPTLETAVQMAPTGPPPFIRRGMMPTMQARDHRTGQAKRTGAGQRRRNLNNAVAAVQEEQSMLPTLTARPGRSGKNKSCWYNSRPLSEVVGGLLNPTWCEWFMGFPAGWTELDASGTPSCPKSQSG